MDSGGVPRVVIPVDGRRDPSEPSGDVDLSVLADRGTMRAFEVVLAWVSVVRIAFAAANPPSGEAASTKRGSAVKIAVRKASPPSPIKPVEQT